ncbi:MAG TPA: hypothetical protein VF173_36320 [Thermoanaerobaculia bacterium]|nr:hypothetical protein [Thermoanaerobaculia bacterium]
MSANGSPPAEFEFDEDHSYFMVRLPVHPAALEVAELHETGASPHDGADLTQSPTQSTQPPTQSPTQSTQSPTQSPTQSTQSPTQSPDPVERLLTLLQAGEQSSGELRQGLGIKHRPTFREYYLQPAMQQGLIEYTLPDKPSSRLQQYRLTSKGRQWMAARGSA